MHTIQYSGSHACWMVEQGQQQSTHQRPAHSNEISLDQVLLQGNLFPIGNLHSSQQDLSAAKLSEQQGPPQLPQKWLSVSNGTMTNEILADKKTFDSLLE